MRKKEAEANLFRFFLRLQPLFAGEPIADWSQPAGDPPDILCRTTSSRMVGVELGSWLDLEQMSRRKQRERIETDLLAAVGEQPRNATRNFQFVWLHPKDNVRMHEINPVDFRRELFDLIAKADVGCADGGDQRRSEIVAPDPVHHPAVAKALRSITCFRGRYRDDSTPAIPWIVFPNWGGPFHPRSMVEALQRCLDQKREK